jgi:hypothetical protein
MHINTYLIKKGLMRAATTGKASKYPASITTMSDSGQRDREKQLFDREQDGLVFGVMLEAVEWNCKTLHKELMRNKDMFDPTKPEFAQGKGHVAYKYLCTRIKAEDVESVLEAVDHRSEYVEMAYERYLPLEDWKLRVSGYESLNDACGSEARDAEQFVRDLIRLLPKGTRRDNLDSLEYKLDKAGALGDKDKAKAVFEKVIRSEHRNQAADVRAEAKMAMEHNAQAYITMRDEDAGMAAKPASRPPFKGGGAPIGVKPRYEDTRPVSRMSDAERKSKLEAMDPCTVCKERHFGPQGPGRCAGDAAVELPANFKDKVTPRRYEKIMKLRSGTWGRAAEECEDIELSLEDLEEQGAKDTPADETGRFTAMDNGAVEEAEDGDMLRGVALGNFTHEGPTHAGVRLPMVIMVLSALAAMVAMMAMGSGGPSAMQAGPPAFPLSTERAMAVMGRASAPDLGLVKEGYVGGGASMFESAVSRAAQGPWECNPTMHFLRVYLGWIATAAPVMGLTWLARRARATWAWAVVPLIVLAAYLPVAAPGVSLGFSGALGRAGRTMYLGNVDVHSELITGELQCLRDAMAFAGNSTGTSQVDQLAVDSGATTTALIGKASFVQEKYKAVRGRYVQVANGVRVPIVGEGPANVVVRSADGGKHTISLKRAIHVPGFATNLLSTRDIWKQRGIRVRFEDDNHLLMPDGATVKFWDEPYYHFRLAAAGCGEGAMMASDGASVHKPTRGVVSKDVPIMTWHSRLGHCGEERMRKLPDMCADAPERMRKAKIPICDDCMVGNAPRLPSSGSVPTVEGWGTVSFDIMGPLPGKRPYLLVFCDLHSRLRCGYLLTHRSQLYSHGIRQFEADTAELGAVRRYHCDNAGENVSDEVKEHCLKHKIRLTTIAPHEPRHNAVSERSNSTICRHIRPMMVQGHMTDSEYSKTFWGYAALAAIDIMNRTVEVRDGKSAFEIAFGRKPRVGHLRPMFCQGWMKIPPPDLPTGHKVTEQGVRCVYLGRQDASYRCWIPGWGVERKASNVTWDEQEFPGLKVKADVQQAVGQVADNWDAIMEPDEEEDATAPDTIARRLQQRKRRRQEESEPDHEGDEGLPSERSMIAAVTEGTDTPKKHSDVLAHKDSDLWLQSELRELQNHEDNNTFRRKVPITEISGARPLNSTWSYKHKVGKEGELENRKSRLSVQDLKGLRRKIGRDFDSSYSDAVRLTAFRTVCCLSACCGNALYQLDFTGAYLQKPVPEDKHIYVRMPPGYPEVGIDKWGNEVEMVYELGRYNYGLQESGFEWQQELRGYLQNKTEGGFERSWVDPNVYYRDTPGGRMWVAVYVDDLLVSVPSHRQYEEFAGALASKYKFTEGGLASHFLGINIDQSVAGEISLSHAGYVKRMVEVHRSKLPWFRRTTPCSSKLKSMVEGEAPSVVDVGLMQEYRAICGALLFTTCAVHVECAYATNMLCRRLVNPTPELLHEAYGVLSYMSAHAHECITYRRCDQVVPPIDTCCDSDWGVGPSVTGYVVLLNGSPVAWRSVRQRCVTMSSCEAELVAANAASMESVYMRHLVEDLTGKAGTGRLASRLHIDNRGCVLFTHNPQSSSRLKHVERCTLKIKEWVEAKVIHTVYIPTKQNIADILTKYTQPSAFSKHACKLRGRCKQN